MNRMIKTLLIWLLLLVLPAQAITSAAKMSCGPNHHATLAEKNVTHAHYDANDVDHHHIEDQAAVIDTELPDLSDASQSVKSAFCSACAACCVGAAVVPSQLEWFPSFAGTFIPALLSPPSFTGHIPAGLERPPRHILS